MVARTAAKPAAASKARTSKPVTKDEDIDLLADMNGPETTQVEEDDDDFDLLSDMSESDAQSWVPQSDEDTPQGIQGTVTHIGTVTQDPKYGGEEVCYWEVQDKSDPDITWGVRGYSTVLNGQMEKAESAGLRTGDFVALKYIGLVWNKAKTNEYHSFLVKSKAVGH
jgi:hypothetical protein